jgi:predicted nicotinamide N-methyase
MPLSETADLSPVTFIERNLRLAPVPAVPEISLYQAHSGSGLSRLDPDGNGPAPYWAFAWGGGLALARHVLDHPGTVAGRRVLDLGAGSGLVGIAAMKAGAAAVLSAETDAYGQAALGLNAEANGVTLLPLALDIAADAPPPVDLILAGDVFYAPDVAVDMLAFLDRCRQAGLNVLVGDPGRRDLPRDRLRLIAEYKVGDMGSTGTMSGVYEVGRAPSPLPGPLLDEERIDVARPVPLPVGERSGR